MEYQTTTRDAARVAADCLIVGVYERGNLGTAAASVNEASRGWLERQIRAGDVSTREGKATLLPAPQGVKAQRILAVGLGKKSEFNASRYRRALGKALELTRDSKIRSVAVGLSLEPVDDSTPYYLGRFSGELLGASLYVFDQMKSKRAPKPAPIGKLILICASRGDANKAKAGAEHGGVIAGGVSLAKDLGNLPANVCTPSYLARVARDQAKKIAGLETKVLGEPEIKRLGMNTFLSVTSGASEPARLIVMQYKGATGKKPIVFVGKGITFDTGGTSLKPPPAMDEMKYDMCGAGSVIAAITVAARLKLPINVVAIVPTCENMLSSTATRPGDIIKSMSGQTVEILNTDAEGRLIMCDAITYSRRFKPDTVIDVATLTGACVIALGHHRTAVMTPADALSDELLAAGVAAEDRAWPLPVTDEYGDSLRSNFADFANVGGREGGASVAGVFLSRFADGLNWAHLDIAGTAWTSGAKKGATGRPVPMLSQFLLERANATPR